MPSNPQRVAGQMTEMVDPYEAGRKIKLLEGHVCLDCDQPCGWAEVEKIKKGHN